MESTAIGDPAASFAAEPTRNLLIVHTPPYQGLSDWLEVKQRIEARAPDIEVRIATNGSPNSVTARWQIQRPSLVFSVSPLFQFKPKGGTVYAGHPMTKLEQIERLASNGFPIPRTEMLSPDLVLDRETWGRYVVLKPWDGMDGRGCPAAAHRRRRRTLSRAHVRRQAPDADPALHRAQRRWLSDRMPGAVDVRPCPVLRAQPLGRGEAAARGDRVRPERDHRLERQDVRPRTDLCDDPEIIALGERAHSAFPECPTLAVDIIRNADTGQLCIMEVNPEGLSWHFSSVLSGTFTAEHIRDLYSQFNALDRVAELLIEKTRAEAT